MSKLCGEFILAFLLGVWFHGVGGLPVNAEKQNGFTLGIIHTNDMHSRFEETSERSTECTSKDAAAKKCYGGFARIGTLVRQARNSSVPTIFLNAGDTYQGTLWFTVHKWKIVSRFLDLLSPDAISLGNHEFDDGIEGLIPFIKEANFPIVTSNLDLTKEPELAATNLKSSTILDVNGTKIGVIGYLTPETKIIASTGEVVFLDEIESIKREVAVLREKGIKILIAVGHSGFAVDKKIASEVDGIDIVIGGHTNTFLYTGESPDREVPEGLYPTEIVQKSGRKVYVVQAYAYTKYLGNITVDFDDEGEVTNIFGNPILVDSSIEQAEDILEELEKWRAPIDNLTNTVIGTTKVVLDGEKRSCRMGECNFGNLVTDAMIDNNVKLYDGVDGWTDAAIAIHNTGIMKQSIDKGPKGKVTMGDVLKTFPWSDDLVKITLVGSKLKEVLEWSVRKLYLNDTDPSGVFLQLSGLKVAFDLSKPAGSKVTSVMVRCATCKVPSFSKLDTNATYTILANEFIHKGGDGYSMLKDQNYVSVDTLWLDGGFNGESAENDGGQDSNDTILMIKYKIVLRTNDEGSADRLFDVQKSDLFWSRGSN